MVLDCLKCWYSSFSTLCWLIWATSRIVGKNSLGMARTEPVAAGWEAWMQPLCFATTLRHWCFDSSRFQFLSYRSKSCPGARSSQTLEWRSSRRSCVTFARVRRRVRARCRRHACPEVCRKTTSPASTTTSTSSRSQPQGRKLMSFLIYNSIFNLVKHFF